MLTCLLSGLRRGGLEGRWCNYYMRKSERNPRGFEPNSWNYRCLQLRHALGWTQKRLAKVMGVSFVVVQQLETGDVTRPSLPTIRKIRNMESAYADILKAYKKHPRRLDRLAWQNHTGVKLLPISVRRPQDVATLGKVEGDSDPLFFGRATRRNMQQTGMPVRLRAHINRRNQAISRALRAKVAGGWRPYQPNQDTQSRQPNGKREGED